MELLKIIHPRLNKWGCKLDSNKRFWINAPNWLSDINNDFTDEELSRYLKEGETSIDLRELMIRSSLLDPIE